MSKLREDLASRKLERSTIAILKRGEEKRGEGRRRDAGRGMHQLIGRKERKRAWWYSVALHAPSRIGHAHRRRREIRDVTRAWHRSLHELGQEGETLWSFNLRPPPPPLLPSPSLRSVGRIYFGVSSIRIPKEIEPLHNPLCTIL